MNKRIARDRAMRSLITPLGIVCGEVLLYIEEQGRTSLKSLIEALPWPETLTVMGVGALIRHGFVRGVEQTSDILLELGVQEGSELATG